MQTSQLQDQVATFASGSTFSSGAAQLQGSTFGKASLWQLLPDLTSPGSFGLPPLAEAFPFCDRLDLPPHERDITAESLAKLEEGRIAAQEGRIVTLPPDFLDDSDT